MALFLTEAGSQYGFGHLVRCLSLAQSFLEKHQNCYFFLRGEGPFDSLMDKMNWESDEWLENPPDLDGQIVIIDSYHCPLEFYEYAMKRSHKLLIFDDNARLQYPGGYLLNSVAGAELIYPSRQSEINYLLGPTYQALRKDFLYTEQKIIGENINRILFSFGGSDPANLTPVYLSRAVQCYPRAKKMVIIGCGFSNLLEIRKVADKYTEIFVSPSASEIVRYMKEADLAVCAAGQTISELACCGVPSYAVLAADNQKNNIRNWIDNGFLLSSSPFDKEPDMEIRRKKSRIGQSIVDGRGSDRITEILLND